MPMFQPAVHPLAASISLTGQTIVITGASSGLGLETARQCLTYNASTVILAVRNTEKGSVCREKLLADHAVKAAAQKYGQSVVKVLKLDMDSYDSVIAFVEQLKREGGTLDLLVLNAALGAINFRRSAATNHEQMTQVNYLSNALLLLLLLPLLRSTTKVKGTPSRVVWIGSRTLCDSAFAGKAPLLPSEGVLARMDDQARFYPMCRYPDTKILALLFIEKLATRVGSGEVVLNMMCPGMIDTGIFDVLPFYFRWPMTLVKSVYARTVEQGGWLVMNAAVVAGRESHGKFLEDIELKDPSAFVQSTAGKVLGEQLWKETMEELDKFANVSSDFEKDLS